jgi:hypothetical protein
VARFEEYVDVSEVDWRLCAVAEIKAILDYTDAASTCRPIAIRLNPILYSNWRRFKVMPPLRMFDL